MSSLLQFALKKDSLVFLGLVEMQTKRAFKLQVLDACALISRPFAVYANSFLGSLNARSHIRNTSTNSGRAYTSENGRTGEFSLPGSRMPVVRSTLSL